MPFKKIHRSNLSTETPEILYRDYRNRKIEGLLSHQADIIREYCEKAVDQSDVALQLPTGSGKTLVGLLIGEWRLRHFREKVVYLCPTKQLAHQVVDQSINKYGIKANLFTGKQAGYDPSKKLEYRNAETIAVTTYSGLFNTNSFFKNADVIILDDAHAAENYIAKYWSLLIDRKNNCEVFRSLIDYLKPILPEAHYLRLISPSPSISDGQWIEKVPTPLLCEDQIFSELISLLDEQVKDSDLKYPWSVIRDHLYACHVYLSYNTILFRPLIPPTRTHQPFYEAKQRLYMSATLGEGGELERLSGVENIIHLTIPDGWNQQGIGRRFFLFPESSLDEDSSLDLIYKMIGSTNRSLVLTPDKSAESELSKSISEATQYKMFNASEIEKSKQDFISSEKAVAVVANRYDGIDLPGDECRLLIIYNLQKATNLQEKFLVTRLAAGVLLQDRIRTRIIQAVGRCTRSATDYATVVILGDELSDILQNPSKRKLLHPELQAEIEFGLEQSKESDKKNFLDILKIFFKHEEEWNDADKDIISLRDQLSQQQLPSLEKLKSAVSHEVKYQYALWNNNFEVAVNECREVLNLLEGDDVEGYRAFWYYLTGSAAWLGAKQGIVSMESVARDNFRRAAKIASQVSWFSQLSRLSLEKDNISEVDTRLNQVIEGLANQLMKLGTANNRKFEAEVKSILEDLNKDEPENSKKFEMAHKKLGQLLGYEAGNSKAKGASDPWWIAGEDLCIVFEDNSGAKLETIIGKNKVQEAAGHSDWIKNNENIMLSKQAEIITVMVTPCTKIEESAIVHTKEVCYWNITKFWMWAENAISVVRELRTSFSGEANLDWRKRAIEAYKDAKIDPASLVDMLSKSKLRDLPRSN
ncbi:DEAD/DEAH box helicase [Limnoraphis robusta]|uniref:DEAD/DEAH box helicase n=1 Tax=Limnoraphis robusta CCNP1315 TaxID=3110306 RepID=A0ABU5TXY6_9CYAN|nr:DEAD/DEAH box helicase [Limnoraphis robusta]MEA5519749.1 DEAD/DEAH box helicase [Limnoraphis robusta CCNP1315]MEA5547403.1 DEAD/DEAH box helicase [Limnoraphis robusta CCNP1324]